jgi:hypothetical protein
LLKRRIAGELFFLLCKSAHPHDSRNLNYILIMKTFLTPVVVGFSSTRVRILLVILAFLMSACGIAMAQMIPEPPGYVAALDMATLDTIGVTALRNVDPSLNGTGVKVAQPEGGNNRAFEVTPSLVNQPTSFFTWISSLGSSNTFPNTVGSASEHAKDVALRFYGKTNTSNPEGVSIQKAYRTGSTMLTTTTRFGL